MEFGMGFMKFAPYVIAIYKEEECPTASYEHQAAKLLEFNQIHTKILLGSYSTVLPRKSLRIIYYLQPPVVALASRPQALP